MFPISLDGEDLIDFVYEHYKIANEHSLAIDELLKRVSQPKERQKEQSEKQPSQERHIVEKDSEFINAQMDKMVRNLKRLSNLPAAKKIEQELIKGNNCLLLGESGIGKTYTPKQIAKENGFDYIQINLDRDTDSADLIGKPIIRPNILTGQQEMVFDEGHLTSAMRRAAQNAQNGKFTILVLDEIFRMSDISPFVSNLSVIDDKEYRLQTDKMIVFAKIKRSPVDYEGTWFVVSDKIESGRQAKVVENNLELPEHFDVGTQNDLGTQKVAELGFRGKLPTIHVEDFRALFKQNREQILETFEAKDTIYVPSRSIAILGTSNVGENYEVNMSQDHAIFGRMRPIHIETPTVKTMVRIALDKYASPEWSEKERETIEKVLIKFYSDMDTKIKKDAKYGTEVRNINFRMIESTVKGIARENPLKDKEFSIMQILYEHSSDFASIDPGLPSSQLEEHHAVNDARNEVELCTSAFNLPFKDPAQPDGAQKQKNIEGISRGLGVSR